MATYTYNPCPPRDWPTQKWTDYCNAHGECSSCQSVSSSPEVPIAIGGSITGGGVEYRPDELLLTATREWLIMTPIEHEQLQQDLVDFEAGLGQDSIERNLALARFYGERGLELMRIQMLDNALFETGEHPDVHIAEELAGALERAGFMEAALQTWDIVPAMITDYGPTVPDLLSYAMINRARIFESLDLAIDEKTALANAHHLQAMAAQLQTMNIQP